LQVYNDCERCFFLRYIEQLAWPAVENEPILEMEHRQEKGQIFHRLVHQKWLGLPTEKLTRLANASDLELWWENFQNYNFNLGSFRLHPELDLTAQIGNHRLTAKYDLVAVSREKILIFDWKTYQKRPREEWLARRIQTRVYCALMIRSGAFLNNNDPVEPDNVEMIYWLANFPNQPVNLPYSNLRSRSDWQYFNQVIARMETQSEFPMTTDLKTCGYCLYRSYCDRGIAALPSGEVEDETVLDTAEFSMDQIHEIEI
jgi:hypothetical protein